MFKKPIKAEITHTIELDEVKEFYSEVKGDLKAMLKTVAWTLGIGIPCVILFGLAANFVGDVLTDNITSTE